MGLCAKDQVKFKQRLDETLYPPKGVGRVAVFEGEFTQVIRLGVVCFVHTINILRYVQRYSLLLFFSIFFYIPFLSSFIVVCYIFSNLILMEASYLIGFGKYYAPSILAKLQTTLHTKKKTVSSN